MHLEGQPEIPSRGSDRLLDAVVAGLDDPQLPWTQRVRTSCDLGSQATAIALVLERTVVDGRALFAQRVAEVAHGGEEEDQPGLVLRHVGGLFRDLHHQRRVLLAVEPVEGGRARIQLIAKDDDQSANRPVSAATGAQRGRTFSTAARISCDPGSTSRRPSPDQAAIGCYQILVEIPARRGFRP